MKYRKHPLFINITNTILQSKFRILEWYLRLNPNHRKRDSCPLKGLSLSFLKSNLNGTKFHLYFYIPELFSGEEISLQWLIESAKPEICVICAIRRTVETELFREL